MLGIVVQKLFKKSVNIKKKGERENIFMVTCQRPEVKKKLFLVTCQRPVVKKNYLLWPAKDQ